MKIAQPSTSLLLAAATFLSPTLAQLLRQSNGNLPSCGQSCPTLTSAQSTCGNSWSCFCQNVWTASGESLATLCSTSCSDPSDVTAVGTWYTANCGSDNGASEHPGSGGSGNSNGNTGGGSSSASTSAAAAGPSTTTNSGISASDQNAPACSSWFNCHWKWVVMIIVLAVGLTALGVGGRIWKKHHDRKKDRISGGFNSGITERSAPQMTSANPNDSFVGGGLAGTGGRNSPMRTREAFMPYGYGYTRSESRLASQGHEAGSPIARGGTPVGELERNVGAEEGSSNGKSRRVLVRER